jgi:hypothetical protein
MQRGANGTWWAILPATDKGTTALIYRVGGLSNSNSWIISSPISINASASCPPVTLTAEEQRAADNIVLGMTGPDQSPVPSGFSCRGIVRVIDSNGHMRSATECAAVLAAAAAAAGGAGAATGAAAGGAALSAGAITALSLAALAAGALIYNNNHKSGNGNQVSPSRP